ncbi:host attachment protein [Massilia sp. H6]|uniref:host attachment protein n=1 Tax=Massilia sp. H6 TaxID=2970464 RepID=UPI002167A615|nr:host attachment protein [Massilia sp. H6]UVW29289.1 host attachment protein [Massilia sp. H6]
MPTTWILSANAGRARFFAESDPAKPLQEIKDMISSGAQMRTQDTETDKLGPTAAAGSRHSIGGHEGAGMAHNAKAGAPNKLYQPAQTPAQHQAELFARDVSDYLLKAHQDGSYQQLIIAASPEFLGTLRQHMDAQVKGLIKSEFNKDYTHSNAQELREHLHTQAAKAE